MGILPQQQKFGKNYQLYLSSPWIHWTGLLHYSFLVPTFGLLQEVFLQHSKCLCYTISGFDRFLLSLWGLFNPPLWLPFKLCIFSYLILSLYLKCLLHLDPVSVVESTQTAWMKPLLYCFFSLGPWMNDLTYLCLFPLLYKGDNNSIQTCQEI